MVDCAAKKAAIRLNEEDEEKVIYLLIGGDALLEVKNKTCVRGSVAVDG